MRFGGTKPTETFFLCFLRLLLSSPLNSSSTGRTAGFSELLKFMEEVIAALAKK